MNDQVREDGTTVEQNFELGGGQSPKDCPMKAYAKPVLTEYGDIRDLTLAPSPFPQLESGRAGSWRSL
jgi:hypothetical protein